MSIANQNILPSPSENHEFSTLLRANIETTRALLQWLRNNKRDIFLFEECFHIVKASLKELVAIQKDRDTVFHSEL